MLPVILWMGVIFLLSTDLGSSAHTGRFLGPLLRWFIPDLSAGTIETAHFLVRKGAHLGGYAVLAILLYRACTILEWWNPAHPWRAGSAIIAACALYAASDEFHQSFVGTRGASVGDVLLDTLGALLGLGACVLLHARRRNTVERVRSTN